MPLLGITGIGGLSLQVYVGDVERAGIGLMSVGQQEIKQGNPLPSGNSIGGLSKAPMANVVQSFPITAENMLLQGH